MKPMVILKPGTMSADDIKTLKSNDLCVVVCKDPSSFKFVDPIPATSQRTKMENAAIRFSRILLNGQWGSWSNANHLYRADFATIYMGILMEGTALDRNGSEEERLEETYKLEKFNEQRRLAREDAKKEHDAKKKVEAKTP